MGSVLPPHAHLRNDKTIATCGKAPIPNTCSSKNPMHPAWIHSQVSYQLMSKWLGGDPSLYRLQSTAITDSQAGCYTAVILVLGQDKRSKTTLEFRVVAKKAVIVHVSITFSPYPAVPACPRVRVARPFTNVIMRIPSTATFAFGYVAPTCIA